MAVQTTSALKEADRHIDYDTFLDDKFDANNYAKIVIDQSNTVDASTLTVALHKLSYSIESINKQIRSQVTSNYEELFKQVSEIKELEDVLGQVQSNVCDLDYSLFRLASKVRDPYEELQTCTTQLENLQEASDHLRKLKRFLFLTQRLKSQIPEESDDLTGKDLSAAALTLYEQESIMKNINVEKINIASKELRYTQKCRDRIEQVANRTLEEGIEFQKELKIDQGLQVFYNLKQLPEKITELTESMLKALERDISALINPGNISNNQPLDAASVWKKLDVLAKAMSDCYVKVYKLEKVLESKKDLYTHASFMDSLAKDLDSDSLVWHLWRLISSSLKKTIDNTTTQSQQHILIKEYPKLLRILQHECFYSIAIQVPSLSDYSQSREYVIMRNSFSTYEKEYLKRSEDQLLKKVDTLFPYFNQTSRQELSRLIDRELQAASVEPILLQAVAETTSKALERFCSKCTEFSKQQILPVTNRNTDIKNSNIMEQYLNANTKVIATLYSMHQSVSRILNEGKSDYHKKRTEKVVKSAEQCRNLMLNMFQEKLMHLIRRDVEWVLVRMHREFKDFSGKQIQSFPPQDDTMKSAYMNEMKKSIQFYNERILKRLSCGVETRSWALQVVRQILHDFVFQASLVSPLTDAGKLKLVHDMAELEMSVTHFVNEYRIPVNEIGEKYEALRSFRQLLFLDSAEVKELVSTSCLSRLILIHQLIIRTHTTANYLPLLHTTRGTTHRFYMEDMEKISEEEAIRKIIENIKQTTTYYDDSAEYRLIQELAEPKTSEKD